MGSYLSHPITEKEIEYGENDGVAFGVAAMQGWRVDMEDAHLCALDVKEQMNVFGVFDGHGGKEVARFVALHFVEELQKTKGFQAADMKTALKEVYMSLDDRIRAEETQEELNQLSYDTKSEERHFDDVVNMDDVPKALKEAVSFVRVDACPDSPQQDSNEAQFDAESVDEEQEVTVGSFPVVMSDSSSQCENGSSGIRTDDSSPQHAREADACDPADLEAVVSLEARIMEQDIEVDEDATQPEPVSKTRSNNCDSSKEGGQTALEQSGPEMDIGSEESEAGSAGEMESISESCELGNYRSTFTEINEKHNSKFSSFFMGGLLSLMCPFRCLRTSRVIPDEETVQISVATEETETPLRSSIPEEPQEAREANRLGIDAPDKEEQDYEHVPSHDQADDVTQAGCTAVVAVIEGQKLYIANAGDSRCVLCHDGVASPLTRDHKPSDPDEYLRIRNAGGFVSEDRVNGCLNLSRAIGDMEYKCFPGLTPEEYMVTANPEILIRDMQPKDQFLILACDGIWDVLSNQQACNFVRARLEKQHSLKSITADLCDHCLAEDTEGSGDGCDNMTAMIIQFKNPAVSS